MTEELKKVTGIDVLGDTTEEIKKLFEKYDVTFFEDLQIWHITELKIEFIKKNNREPQSKTYPNWLVFLNEIKNKIKCHF